MEFSRSPLIDVSVVPGVENAQLFIPVRKSDDAVGYDVMAFHVLDPNTREVIDELPITLQPGETTLIGCGYIAAIPKGVDCQVRPRSGLAAKHQIILANGPGTVDPDYRGEIGCLLYNVGKKPFVINYADRIAQLIFTPILLPEFRLVASPDLLPSTQRGTGGFGSTGLGASEGFGTSGYRAAIKEKDIFFLEIAQHVGTKSNCIRGCQIDAEGIPLRGHNGELIGATRKIGCVIVLGESIVATGFNQQYPGAQPCAEVGCIRERLKIPSGQQLEICQAIHAEDAAMNNALAAGVRVVGGTMYCTAEPCRLCARKIAALNLEALVIISGGYSSSEGVEMVRGSGKIVREISIEEIINS